MSEGKFQEQFLENRFISTMTIIVISGAALFWGAISENVWQYTSLFALAIFSGAKVFDAQNLAIMKSNDSTRQEEKDKK